MNAIQILAAQPWVERLRWTLLHFLWQGLLLCGVYGIVRRGLARSGPNARYLAGCLTLAAMVAAPIATFLWLSPAGERTTPVDATARVLYLPEQAVAGPTMHPAAVAVPPEFVHAAPQVTAWIVAIWLIGAALFWLRLAGGWWMTARMRSRQIRAAAPAWQQTLNRLRERLRVSRPVRLLISARVDVPTVVGWLRPVILLPLGALSGLPAEHIEALLLHELAHIRRHDYFVNVLQSIAEALLFYHPGVWWISGHIRAERELCCDDLAVAATGDAVDYAIALTDLEACRQAHVQSALAANGGKLAQRIARLLGQSLPESRTFSNTGAAASAVALALTACVVFGQPAERPKFEVASIKPQKAPQNYARMSRPLPGGRLSAENIPLRTLMMRAYRLQDFQIAGGPAWLNNDGYNIQAKGNPQATNAEVMLMLQSLLEDRFQLQYHRETRELPVYALTVARGGAKLPELKEGGCFKPDAAVQPPPGSTSLPACGSMNMMATPTGMSVRGGNLPMSEFVRQLSDTLGRPVLDRTGIATHFDVHLEFSPDETTAGLMAGWGSVQGHRETMAAAGAAASANDPQAAPNILTALQEQLGLKLEATKGPVEVMVIDHLERPSEN